MKSGNPLTSSGKSSGLDAAATTSPGGESPTTPNPEPSFQIQRGDRLLVLGSPDTIDRLHGLLGHDPEAD